MANPASVLDRVRALIELSGSKSESGLDGEATAAAIKACKMIREHKLTVTDGARPTTYTTGGRGGMSWNDLFGGGRGGVWDPQAQQERARRQQREREEYDRKSKEWDDRPKPSPAETAAFEAKKKAERERIAAEQREKVDASAATARDRYRNIQDTILDAVRQAEARTPDEWAAAAAAATEKPKPKEEKK